MADYIYLLENRLTPAQVRALGAVREAARAHSMPVFLVGGAVRDLSSGTPVRDLDFAVQGDVSALLEHLTSGGAVVAGENPTLSSVYLIFPGGVRAELGSTLTVAYPQPGHPEAHSAVILDDLRRRDFAVNAMAISLNEGSYGLLLDPLNGIADIENRELRLVSNYGFIEQPALLLRAARLSERLGWGLEERTQGRYATAKEENYIAALPERDRGYELEEIFHEEDPLAALENLNAEGWREVLFPAWTAAKADREALERVRDLIGQLEQLGIHTDPSPVFFPLLTAKLSASEVSALKGMFARPGFVQQIDTLDARSRDLGNQITGRSAGSPSETWKMLFAAEPEVVLWLAYSSRSGAVQTKIKAFLTEWPQMRHRIPYALMQEMRITPDLPGYEDLLRELFFALIDGKLATPEATRAFLEPYSPPAPVIQTAPRRRPAKSTRSRSRKVVEELPEPQSGDAGDSGATPSDADHGESRPSTGQSTPPSAPAEVPAAKKTPVKVPAKKTVPEHHAPEAQAPAPAKVSAPRPAPVKTTVPAKTPTKVAAPVKKAPAKQTSHAPAATKKPGKSAAKTHTPPPKKAAKKVEAPAKGKAAAAPAKHKELATKKTAKKAAKSVGKVPPAKGGAKKAAKQPAGKTAAKKHTAKAASLKKVAKSASRGRR